MVIWMKAAVVCLVAVTLSGIPQTVPTAQLREEMRIVSNDASVNTSLTSVSPGSLVMRDGRIITLHVSESVLRVFDANGRFLAMFGRAGDGPGEFRTPLAAGRFGGGDQGIPPSLVFTETAVW